MAPVCDCAQTGAVIAMAIEKMARRNTFLQLISAFTFLQMLRANVPSDWTSVWDGSRAEFKAFAPHLYVFFCL
jgi:hypothetical protein